MSAGLPFVGDLWSALGGDARDQGRMLVIGTGDLPSVYRVTDLAVASIGAVGLATSELASTITDAAPSVAPSVTVDRELASSWFGAALAPVGWRLPPVWDPIAGNYRADDGWIRLHTNAPHHRAAALSVLGVRGDVPAVTKAVRRWSGEQLESAIVTGGGCAAAMRSREEWLGHPQGRAVASEALLDWADGEVGPPHVRWRATPARPLEGLRVLDLTRVIAGPVATRFLAALGADVLRVDPPQWQEDALVSNMTLGKRTARLDAKRLDGAATLKRLLQDADVLVHGYRDGALDSLGLDAPSRRRLRPGLVEASLDAYGFTGPWSGRRGFDSLVQMSSGIAHRGMAWALADEPTPLPVQALDHATGCLLAAAVIRSLTLLRRDGRGRSVRTSLARVAELLVGGGELPIDGPLVDRVAPSIPLDTPWGPMRMLPQALAVAGSPLHFARGPVPLGAGPARWL
ncbi:MAG: hypothetical protein RI885_329 [Actinomycetota bacterium]|jgi:crotonobetainyl-CoA:carnitine CoA-transferase CaiB-like acyl-CoA transferase